MTKKSKTRRNVFFALLSFLSLFTFGANKNNAIEIDQDAFKEMSKEENVVVIDVRRSDEYKRGFIPGAINIPHKEILSGRISLEKYKDKKLIFYCRSGTRAGYVTDHLLQTKFTPAENIFHLSGDYLSWAKKNRAIAQP